MTAITKLCQNAIIQEIDANMQPQNNRFNCS